MMLFNTITDILTGLAGLSTLQVWGQGGAECSVLLNHSLQGLFVKCDMKLALISVPAHWPTARLHPPDSSRSRDRGEPFSRDRYMGLPRIHWLAIYGGARCKTLARGKWNRKVRRQSGVRRTLCVSWLCRCLSR